MKTFLFAVLAASIGLTPAALADPPAAYRYSCTALLSQTGIGKDKARVSSSKSFELNQDNAATGITLVPDDFQVYGAGGKKGLAGFKGTDLEKGFHFAFKLDKPPGGHQFELSTHLETDPAKPGRLRSLLPGGHSRRRGLAVDGKAKSDAGSEMIRETVLLQLPGGAKVSGPVQVQITCSLIPPQDPPPPPPRFPPPMYRGDAPM